MRKFFTQLGIFILLLFHFGCSGVQNRTAFGGGDFNTGNSIFQIDTTKGFTKLSGTKDIGVSHSPTVVSKSDFYLGTFDLGEKVEQKIHRMNQKVWIESGKLPKGVEKLKPIKAYREFLKSGKSKSNWESDNKGTTLMIVGLILGLLGYLMIIAADSGWFGLGLGGSNFSGCLVVLLGLVFLISALVLLIVGVVTALA